MLSADAAFTQGVSSKTICLSDAFFSNADLVAVESFFHASSTAAIAGCCLAINVAMLLALKRLNTCSAQSSPLFDK